jgi:hypothetical protein
MAGTKYLVLFVAVLLALSGCSAFFDFNAFSSLDKPAAPDPSRYTGASGLANLQNDLNSQAVVNALKNDPADVTKILGNLNSSYNVLAGGYTTPDQQTAAILYSDLALKSTSGDILVNNIVANVMTQAPGNLQSVLSSIVPPDVAADFTKFSNMVNGLLTAETVYINIGNSTPLPVPGMNMGDIAQKAAVSCLMKAVFDAATPGAGAGNEITQLFAMVNNQPNSVSGANVADPFASSMTGVPWLKNIFDAAGAPYPV